MQARIGCCFVHLNFNKLVFFRLANSQNRAIARYSFLKLHKAKHKLFYQSYQDATGKTLNQISVFLCLFFLPIEIFIGIMMGHNWSIFMSGTLASFFVVNTIISITLLIGAIVFTFFRLTLFANLKMKQPKWVLDNYGLARFGRGLERDLFVEWHNIKKFKGYGRGARVFKIWFRDPHDAWAASNPLLVVLTWLKRVFTLNMLNKRYEFKSIKVDPREWHMEPGDFEQLLEQRTGPNAEGLTSAPTDWTERRGAKINPLFKLLYLLMPASMLLGHLLPDDVVKSVFG